MFSVASGHDSPGTPADRIPVATAADMQALGQRIATVLRAGDLVVLTGRADRVGRACAAALGLACTADETGRASAGLTEPSAVAITQAGAISTNSRRRLRLLPTAGRKSLFMRVCPLLVVLAPLASAENSACASNSHGRLTAIAW